MNSTASRIRKRVCALLWKNANPTGKIAERRRRVFRHSMFRRAVFNRALTLRRLRHTLKFQFAGKGRFVKEFARARHRSAVFAAIAALLSCAALSRAQSASPISSASLAFREVTDEVGRTVRVPQPVRRIVSLAPSLTETVYALG